jgi:broad specificity phosphatase PhoE
MYHKKVIHIVRHAQGFHNLSGNGNYADASLTNLGWQQSKELSTHLDVFGIKAQVELVVVSPLLRTLQTTIGIWDDNTMFEEGPKDDFSTQMVSALGEAFQATISTPKLPKFVANEWCREKMGKNLCNQRSNIIIYKRSFPNVDFSEIETDADTWWQKHRAKSENSQDLFARANTFIEWLLDRPESQIFVVSHGTFIFHMCQLLSSKCFNIMEKVHMQKSFNNCEMCSITINYFASKSFPFSCHLMEKFHFRGGLQYKSTTIEEQAGASCCKGQEK